MRNKPLTESLTVRNDQRVGAIGRTRMGKTYLMERLLSKQPRVIVIDTKGDINWPGYHLTFAPDAALQKNVHKVILRILEHQEIPPNWWTRAMRHLQSIGGGIIYVDEAPVITTPNYIPKGLRDVVRVGGGIGVGVWWSAQESTGVSNVLLRQTDILCLFHNNGASDRDKIIGTVGDMGEVTKGLERYEFVVYRSDEVYIGNEFDVWKASA